MPLKEASSRRPNVLWFAIPILCLGSAFVGGVVVSRSNAERATASLPEAKGTASGSTGAQSDEVRALRADVNRLGHVVTMLAVQSAAAPGSAPVEKHVPSAPPADSAELTLEEITTLYESSPPNSYKTRSLASSLDDRLKKESLASASIKVDEVECRGSACRARVSFAESAQPEPILLELAAALPDSHSFQDFAPAANNRRTVISHYIDESESAGRSASAHPPRPEPGSAR